MVTSRARLVEGDGLLSAVVEREVGAPAAGEALIRVHATSVNFHDLIGIDGGVPGCPVPRVPFSDASATVVALGEGVSGVALGDAVIPNFFPHWIDGELTAETFAILGDQIDGTLQTHVRVPAHSLARAPAGLSHDEIATLGCAALTAWRALYVEARLRPGRTVLLQGTGGLSLAALGLAKAGGARVILTSSSDEKLARARTLGADETINYRDRPDWEAEVMTLTGGRGADVVVDVGGTATLARSIGAVRFGGHVAIVGVLSGFETEKLPIPLIMGKNVRLSGVTVASRTELDAMCRAVEAVGYKPVIDSVYPLERAHEAIAAVRAQQHFGKIVITL